ncbi:choline dehydrogenase, partial [Geosmithia morbida]
VALALAAQLTDALGPVTEISESYDFVIVGGGQAGLVLGGRLSEDKNHTVLVLEAGQDGDDYRTRIDTPADSYFDSLWQTPLNWNFSTTGQAALDNRAVTWPRGKTLGGSSAINGLYMTRPGTQDLDAWHELLGDMEGADAWTWSSFYQALIKSENFTGATESIASEANILWNTSDHGSTGPIHTSYPGYTFAEVGNWTKAFDSIGVSPSGNMYGGDVWGAEISTSCINTSNWTRSYSRTGYLDPLPDNGNYDVLANAHVTRVVFDDSTGADNLTATGVEYTMNNGTTIKKVKVNKEVIISSGSIGSPAVLMYSGVGPKDVLKDAGIDLVYELPGVGQHLQDHLSATLMYEAAANTETAGTIWYRNGTDKTDTLYLSYINSAIAYVNSTFMYGDDVDSFSSDALSNRDKYKPDSAYEDNVVAGYQAIFNTTASTIWKSPIGQVELLLMNSDAWGKIGITAALQHPLSHGRVYVNSSNPLDYPIIDPNYLDNPADLDMLIKGLKIARSVAESSPYSGLLVNETSPGIDTQTDAEWKEWLNDSADTEFHPSSTCAMLPRDQGGVVDAKLRVYGFANLRVADASVPPISFSSHLMSSTYGIAEKASEIIRKDYAKGSSSTFASTGTNGDSDDGDSAAVSLSSSWAVPLVVAAVLGLYM